MRSVLYISYDGMLEPLGQSQVLAYMEHLAKDRDIHLLSFEKLEDLARDAERSDLQRRINAAGIRWHPRRYHKQPSSVATAWDIGVGAVSASWLVLRYRIGVVHARSYVAAVMALLSTRLTGAKLLFDMRGFWADERVDGGLWPRGGRMYRVAKWFERMFLLSANHVISLTQAGVREMHALDYLQGRMPAMTVIPTCADLERFKPLPVPKDSGFVLGYVGSAGTWYLFDVTVACFVQLRKLRPDARMLIINRNEHEFIRQRLEIAGVPEDSVELRSASHAEIPAQMARMHATAFFIKPVFSKQASAPTKLAEFLGCGIPCLSNAGVGDMAEILEGERVGVAVEGFEPEALAAGLQRLLSLLDQPGIEKRCVDVARKHFSLQDGVAKYVKVYEALERAA
jgi:glycosyltransferase involved in cell wall biosynthesis